MLPPRSFSFNLSSISYHKSKPRISQTVSEISLTMHSNIFFIWFVVFIIFLSSYTAFSDHDYRYSKCSQLFSCGNLTNIGYPFWGEARPSYCGAPGYKLQCRNGLVPEIQINSLTYQISRINLTNLIMRITRTDFLANKQCPSSFNNGSAIDSNLFKYALTNTNLTLFYGNCTPRPGVAALYQFRCNNSVGDSIIGYGFRELPRIVPNCRVTIGVLVAEEAFGRFMSRDLTVDGVLKEGFEVGFVSNASFCDGCEGSGGRCGFDFDVKQPTCFCQDGVYKGGKCPNNTATGNATGTQSPPGDGDHKRGVKIAIAASVAGTLMVFIGIAILCYLRRKGLTEHCFTCCLRTRTRDAQKLKFKELLRDHQMLAPKIFKYSDLKKITNSFQDKLGQGGYGSVFKGQLPDGRLVAVKILSETKGNGEEFINEVASISRTSHINIVPLLGFCIQGRKRALVYEFMPNGSLEKFIFIKGVLSEANKLEWDALYKIAIGTARGLEYLHRGCHTRIVHFDIKPHNILLDQDFCPKISDFGLAKLCFKKDSIVSIKGTRGTIGYIAPELVSRNFGGVSHKSDVYSYGMMVLEMVGGRKNVDVNVDNTSEIYFPHWIYKQLDHCEDLGLCRAVTEEEREIARKMTIVGLWCIQIDPLNRPSMNEVLDMLEGSVEDLQIPPKPYLSSPPRPNQVSSTTSMS